MARRSTVVTRSHLTSSPSGKVEAELSRLASADLNTLRRRWRTLFGGAAPDLPQALLRRILPTASRRMRSAILIPLS